MVPFSPFLEERAAFLTALIGALSAKREFVSVLGTDVGGIRYTVKGAETDVEDSIWTERGFVFRVQDAGAVAEYAVGVLPGGTVNECSRAISEKIGEMLAGGAPRWQYPKPVQAPLTGDFSGGPDYDPLAASPQEVIARLRTVKDKVLASSPLVASARAVFHSARVSKCFYSKARALRQSYGWSEAYAFCVVRRGDRFKDLFEAASGRKGPELLDEIENGIEVLVGNAAALLDSGKIEPGEYDVICSPEVAGILAHEAFGHGVEADMFVSGRAKAAEYLGRRVGSPLVNMFDGAAGLEQTGSYFFDDEGEAATKTQVIRDGILVSPITDALSAAALGAASTGNGRRESFARKAYARMTNTYFAPGGSKLADMIASVDRGWLLERSNSGMEDPRNWGIQLVLYIGREIVCGELTGRIVSPVIVTGYVPDVLASVSMASDATEYAGSGYCGKGHKERVKVSSGGPYLKTRMRLG